MSNTSMIYTDCQVHFTRLNNLLAEQGPVEAPGGVTLKSIALRGDDVLLYADAEVQGMYNGGAVLKFRPGYDAGAKAFTVSDVQISLEEDNMFAKFAGKMINNILGDKLDDKIQDLINSKFNTLMDEVLTQLRSVALPKGGVLHFETENWQLSDLRTSTEGIHFVAALSGKASLDF